VPQEERYTTTAQAMTVQTAVTGRVLHCGCFIKKRGDMGERNTEELKQGKGDYSDTRGGERKIGVTILQCIPTHLDESALWSKCNSLSNLPIVYRKKN